ncbi:MAG: fasciclin domain-containing protein [Acidimicrobiales bacterium]
MGHTGAVHVGRVTADRNLVGPLSDPDAGPFTVFAPTNEAFASANSCSAASTATRHSPP